MFLIKVIHFVLLVAYTFITFLVVGYFSVTWLEEGVIKAFGFMSNIGYSLLWVIAVATIHWVIVFIIEVRKDAEQN